MLVPANQLHRIYCNHLRVNQMGAMLMNPQLKQTIL